MAVERGWVYEDNDDTVVYRASSLYSCIRSMVAARTGETAMGPHANLRAAMDASSGLESVLLKRVAAELRGELIWEQKEVEIDLSGQEFAQYLSGGPIIRGHIDAMHKDSDSIVEAKALGDTLYNQYVDGGLDAMGKLGTKYKWQMSSYGYATGRKVRLAVGHKVKTEDGFVIEEVDISQPYAPEDLVPLTEIIDYIRAVEDFAARDELPECNFGCTPSSPYSEVHLFPSALQGDAEMESRLARFQEIKALVGSKDKGTGLLGEMEEISEWLKENFEPGTHVAGPFTARLERAKPTERIDVRRLRKEHPDIADMYTVFGSPTLRLTVKGGIDD